MHSRFVVVPALLLGLGLSACSGPASGEGDDTLTVVTSTSAYGDIVRQVAGDSVTVDSIIDRPSQDPHSYEATPQDKLTLSHADLVVENGGGYDSFVDLLTRGLGIDDSAIITAIDYSEAAHAEDHEPEPEAGPDDHDGHDHTSFNEHVWYDLPTASAVAAEVADRLGELKPEEAETFTANAREFATKIDTLEERLGKLSTTTEGHQYAMTEPVPYYLLERAGLSDGTPEGFSGAIEAGNDVSPLLLNALDEKLSAGGISLLAFNPQTSSPQTQIVRAQAEDAGVPVVEFTATRPQATADLGWMGAHIDAIPAAGKG
ncbi:MAG: zinc ABC transporter substrate-binding protein [Micrococcaceae bacterium]|nr:zinc ABC transporter substrate-binding protein [Micrococcaceae bacterium]